MFGLEILDIVIGLTFIYLLLSLMATAINEYVAALSNKRGKELAKGIARLLDDIDGKDGLGKALAGLRAQVGAGPRDSLTERFYSHRLIRPLAPRRGWIMSSILGDDPRLPSYVPARTFALALLDVLGYKDDAKKPETPQGTRVNDDPEAAAAAVQRRQLIAVMELLKRESALDVSEHVGTIKGLLESATLDSGVKLPLLSALTASQTPVQKLHDSVEVWFNNSMDRVTGAYKRHTQAVLFLIGAGVAVCLNADTIQMWRTLATNDVMRDAMATRAAAAVPALHGLVYPDSATPPAPASGVTQPAPKTSGSVAGAGTTSNTGADTSGAARRAAGAPKRPDSPAVTVSDSAAAAAAARETALHNATGGATGTGTPAAVPAPPSGAQSAAAADTALIRKRYADIRAQLDSMELQLGWTWEEAARLGFAARDTKGKAIPGVDVTDFQWLAMFAKLVGLLMTALAISMGAPFWFDTLNKVISIRTAGRSPAERPKSPEGPAKRAAEQPNK
jgi:hypothetical protein